MIQWIWGVCDTVDMGCMIQWIYGVQQERGIIITAYRPVGLPPTQEVVDIAKRLDVTPQQVMISWSHHVGNTVISKTANAEHMMDNLKAIDIKLTEDDLKSIGQAEKRVEDITRAINPDRRDGTPWW
eukprot:GHVO01068500.1.p1 GENE.GHVO01068500.1~~GHVO01068500.1.p1  ORF type:complete len:127 (+),score=27.81 GHVO01068500.1:222-602(+)